VDDPTNAQPPTLRTPRRVARRKSTTRGPCPRTPAQSASEVATERHFGATRSSGVRN
jgi:hypothetical protein